MLPLAPRSAIDAGLGGGALTDKDETATDDGWAVISGTSAACPQLAGVCALLRQSQPGLSPALVKRLVTASARDVTTGKSAMGQPAGDGHDGATGAGLVDAARAYVLSRSTTRGPPTWCRRRGDAATSPRRSGCIVWRLRHGRDLRPPSHRRRDRRGHAAWCPAAPSRIESSRAPSRLTADT